jgi:Putative Flp pilus-assembly TadE/G-like
VKYFWETFVCYTDPSSGIRWASIMYKNKTRFDYSSQNGNVTLVFALSGVALVGVVGGGVEITRVVDGRAKLQSAVDAGALASAGMPDGTFNSVRSEMANKVTAANLQVDQGIVTGSLVVVPDFTQSDRVKLDAEVKLETILGKSMFGGFHTIKVSSTAQKATAGTPEIPGTQPNPVCPVQPAAIDAPAQPLPPPPPPPPSPPPAVTNGCIWALSTDNKDGTLRFNSGNKFVASQCRIHVHSAHYQSVQWNSGNELNIDKLFTKGGVNCNATCLSSFVTNAGNQVEADPYATGLPQLTAGTCMPNNGPYNGSVTLSPGTYCSDVTVQGNNPVVTLLPGIYHIKGNWNLNGATVNGNGVTLYFEGDTQWNLNGNTRLNLTAPSSGPTAGLAMYEKYGLGTMTRPIDAGGGMDINGIIYFPSKLLNFNSNNNVSGSMKLQIIAKEVIFDNTRYNIRPYDGPLPPKADVTSAAATTTAAATPPVSTGSGLFTNGSFEQPVITPNTFSVRSIVQGLPGWTTTRQFELQSSATWTGGGGFGTDGVQYAEVEKDLSQSVTLPAGKTYRLQFDYRTGDNGSAADNRFIVNWDGKQLADIKPVISDWTWKRMIFPIRGTGSPVSITISQVAGADFNHGPFFDRMRIEEDNSMTAPPDGCPGGLPLPPPPPPTPAVPPTPLRIIR